MQGALSEGGKGTLGNDRVTGGGDTRGQSGNSREGSDTKEGDNRVMVSSRGVTEGSEVYQVPRGC